MDDCIFCKIVNGELPSFKIYEDDEFLAFLDIFPATEGYTLVIPKKHFRWVWDVDNIGGLFEACKRVAKHFQNVTGNDSVYGLVLGEEVPHAHVRMFSGADQKMREKIYDFVESTRSPEQLSLEKAKEVLDKFTMNVE